MPTPTSGHYEERNGTPVIRFERTFPHPVHAVWVAISDPAQLQAWFPTTVEFGALAPGEPIVFRFPDDAYPALHGELRTVEPPRRLMFTWGDDVLSFELQERDGGGACRLAFTVELDNAGKAARDGAGWESCLDMLAGTLRGTPPERPAGEGAWRAYYDAYRERGLPATAEIPH
jgi:uncharacterized protein YndB with AHSA1/START domain